MRRCVTKEEVRSIIWNFRNSPYGGHYNGEKRSQKSYKEDFIGTHYSKTHISMLRVMKIAKGSEEYPNEMKCIYKTCYK